MRLKKERLLKASSNPVRDSMEHIDDVLQQPIDYEKWHVESRKENFSLYSQNQPAPAKHSTSQSSGKSGEVVSTSKSHQESVESNKLQALNDILKGAAKLPFSMLKEEDEEEFE